VYHVGHEGYEMDENYVSQRLKEMLKDKSKETEDEKCVCGHLKFQHSGILPLGHGYCEVQDCKCLKFTAKE
jgi:hypothetical protein